MSSSKNGKARRVSIGFDGGQVLPLRVSQAQLDSLRGALSSGDGGWIDVELEDGSLMLDAGQAVFLRVDSDEHRVGF